MIVRRLTRPGRMRAEWPADFGIAVGIPAPAAPRGRT
jgi:hypothetical protein